MRPTGQPPNPPGYLACADRLSAKRLHELIQNDLLANHAKFRCFGYEDASVLDTRSDYTCTVASPSHMTLSIGQAELDPAAHLSMSTTLP